MGGLLELRVGVRGALTIEFVAATGPLDLLLAGARLGAFCVTEVVAHWEVGAVLDAGVEVALARVRKALSVACFAAATAWWVAVRSARPSETPRPRVASKHQSEGSWVCGPGPPAGRERKGLSERPG